MVLRFNYNGKIRHVGVIKLDDSMIQGIVLDDLFKEVEAVSLENYFKSIPCSFIEDKQTGELKPFIDISDKRDFDLRPYYKNFRKFSLAKISQADLKSILVQIAEVVEQGKEEKKKIEQAVKKIWKFEDGSEEVLENKEKPKPSTK